VLFEFGRATVWGLTSIDAYSSWTRRARPNTTRRPCSDTCAPGQHLLPEPLRRHLRHRADDHGHNPKPHSPLAVSRFAEPSSAMRCAVRLLVAVKMSAWS